MGKGRTKPSVMPVDRTGEDRPLLFVGWIDALPVPAALIRPMARGNFRLHASNAAFDRLGLSPVGVDAPIELLRALRSEEHTSELPSLMRTSYAIICLKKTKTY